MNNLFRTAAQYKWFPDADSVGAPPGVLLRADNTVPDKTGARAMRRGSVVAFSGLQDQRVASLHSVELDGTVWHMAGADSRVYTNGGVLAGVFDGSGDISFGDDSYQVFAARGTVRKKWDGVTFNNWGIDAPTIAPTLNAVDTITEEAASFDIAEAPAFVVNEGVGAFVTGQDGSPNGALQLTPDLGTGRTSASKKFPADQDYQDIGGIPGGNTDLFDCRIWFQNWRKVEKVTFMFGLGTGADPYADDYYYFDFNIRQQDTVNVKDAPSNTAAAYKIAGRKSLNILTPQEVTNIRRPEEASEVLKRLGRFAGPRSTERRDAQESSPAWGHLTVTKGQFNRVGGTATRNWSTVRAFKVVYTVIPGSTEVAYFDDAVWTGGGSLALTGAFTVGYRFARRFTLADSTEVYYELSPMSPVSTEAVLNQQSLEVTIPSAALAAKDPQVTEVWAYIQGGWLDTYYRFAILSATPRTGMSIDELNTPAGGNFDTPEDRVRLTSWGFTAVTGAGASATNVVFTGGVSELEILIDNEPYTPGTAKPPENIIAIAGPWDGRMFVLDDQGYLYPSAGDSPSSFSVYHSIDLRRYGTPLWLVKTASGIVAGCTKDIIRISGSGDESEDRVILDLFGDPLNIGNPPVDKSAMVDGNTVVYRAADGFMALTGNSLSPVPYAGTSLLWRGHTRHGVQPLNLTGRYRLEVDNHIMYALMTETGNADPNTIWRFDFADQQWCRFIYPFTPLSIFRDPSGRLLVGTTVGTIVEIENGEQDEGTAGVPVEVWTPIDDGGDPMKRKDAVDLQIHVNTAGSVGNIGFFKDGMQSASLSVPFSSLLPSVFRSDLTALGVFTKLQSRMTGTFTEFILSAFGVTYRPRPQQVMALDLGYIMPANNGDMAWLTEAELDCISPVNLSLLVYRDDVLFTAQPVIVDPSVRSSYRVTLPHNTKSRRLRLVVKTTNPPGTTDLGFEPYDLKVRYRGSGNMVSLMAGRGDSA